MKVRLLLCGLLVAVVAVVTPYRASPAFADAPEGVDTHSALSVSDTSGSSCVYSVEGFVMPSTGTTLTATHKGFWMRCYLGSAYPTTIVSGTGWGAVTASLLRYAAGPGQCQTGGSGGSSTGGMTSTSGIFRTTNLATEFYDPATRLLDMSGEVFSDGTDRAITCWQVSWFVTAGGTLDLLGSTSFRMVDYATRYAEFPDHRWFGPYENEAAPSCQEMGINYETRAAGVGNDWEPVTPGAWPVLNFGDSIRWTIDVDDDYQIDHLAFTFRGKTPIKDTGEHPYFMDYQLGGSTQLLDHVTMSETELTPHTLTGIGVNWPIRPGSSEAQQVGGTHTGTLLFLGTSGTRPLFGVQCHVYDSGLTYEIFDQDSETREFTTVLSEAACDESMWRVVRQSTTTTETVWGFRLVKSATTTLFDKLEWRYNPSAGEAGDWASIYDPADTAAALTYDFTIAKADAPTVSGVEFRCTGTVAGGGTETTTGGSVTSGGASAEGGESCYGEALDDMSLTSPRTWVEGIGRMGTCVVEWLFVPDSAALSESFGDFKEELTEQLPFSIVYSVIAFGANFYDAAQDSTDSGCMDMGGSWSFGSYGSVSVPDVCIGDDVSVSPGQRQTLVWLMLGGLWFAVVRHAFALVRGTPAYGGHQG